MSQCLHSPDGGPWSWFHTMVIVNILVNLSGQASLWCTTLISTEGIPQIRLTLLCFVFENRPYLYHSGWTTGIFHLLLPTLSRSLFPLWLLSIPYLLCIPQCLPWAGVQKCGCSSSISGSILHHCYYKSFLFMLAISTSLKKCEHSLILIIVKLIHLLA